MVKGEKRRLRFSYTEHDGKAGKVAKDVNENMARKGMMFCKSYRKGQVAMEKLIMTDGKELRTKPIARSPLPLLTEMLKMFEDVENDKNVKNVKNV